MEGAAVHASILGGQLHAVRCYCETDVMNTYLVYQRFRLLRGEIDAGEYANEISFARGKVVAANAPHWQEFIAAWDANSAVGK